MKKEFSIYLDLVRFLAAVMVVISHANFRILSAAHLPFSDYGHAAVMIFFVLSGYVISYVVTERERDPISYWSSRLSRFYSLAIPIVLLSPLLDWAGSSMAPAFYAGGRSASDLWGVRMISSLLFTNEIWTLSIQSFSNVPYWSLCYEMWYYAMFAVFAFTRGRKRIVLLALTCLFVGPKVMLLAPIWALGVVLHRWQRLYLLANWQYWLLFLGSIPALLIFQHFDLTKAGDDLLLGLIGPHWFKQVAFSRHVIFDYPLALIVAANFIGFRGIAHCFSGPLLLCERPIRWIASFTFALYLLHQPLLNFFGALFNGDPGTPWFLAQVMCATLASVVVIGLVTEHRRGHLRAAIRRLLIALTGSRWWPGTAVPQRQVLEAGK